MKFIYVPKNKEALIRLDYNKTEKDDLLELPLEKEVFYELSKAGFFQAINKLAHANIDDFEDEGIVEEVYLNGVIKSDIFNEKKYTKAIFAEVEKIKSCF